MYASIAGLKAHMQKLNVIGNNVANVNTAGYKTKRTIFKDSIYTMYSSGSNGTTTIAGKNPSQIGYGTLISSIDINMSTGNYNPGNPTDCMLDGDGFFLVGQKDVMNVMNGDPKDAEKYKSLTLSRVGDFSFKADGYLSDAKENAVYGFMCVGTAVVGEKGEKEPIFSDQLVPIRLPQIELVETKDADGKVTGTERVIRWPVVATGGKGGGDADDDEQTEGGINSDGVAWGQVLVGGTEGNDAFESVEMKDYSTYLEDKAKADGDNNNNNDEDAEKRDIAFVTLEDINISATGKITGVVKETKELITIGYIAVGNVTNPNGLSHDGGHYYTCGDGAGDLSITMLGNVGQELYGVGGGHLEYVNGSLVEKGDDEDISEVMGVSTSIGSAGKTGLMSGFLEGSNADLATEISELITTQRGYQANTRIVTVTDSMLEELVNMKR